MEEGTINKKQVYKDTVKRYILPTIMLFLVLLSKLAMVGLLKEIYLWLTGTPIYMENETLGLVSVFALVLLDMVVGVLYVWVKHLGKEVDTEELKELHKKSDGKYGAGEEPRLLTTKEAIYQTVNGDGLKRGFNYLWMASVSSVLVTVLWSGVTLLMLKVLESAIVSNPETFLSLYIFLGLIRSLVSGLIKSGVLSYTVNATLSEGNILKAWMYTTLNIFKLAVIDINYIVKTVLGLILFVIGAFATHSIALSRKSQQWDTLVRNYERRVLYGKVKE